MTMGGLDLLFNLYSRVLSAKIRALSTSQSVNPCSRYPDVLESGTPEYEAIVVSAGPGRPEYDGRVLTTGPTQWV
jgi:hypothetical protein